MTVAAGLVGAQQEVPTAVDEVISGQVRALADEFLAAYLDRYPEVRTYYGLPGRHDRLSNQSVAAIAQWERNQDGWMRKLDRAEPSTLTPGAFVTHGILSEHLSASRAQRVCRPELWAVNDQTGWQVFVPLVFEFQPVESAQQRADAIARALDVRRFIGQEIRNAAEGLDLGYSAPRGNVAKVIEQVRGLLDPESPFYSPAERATDAAFVADYTAAVEETVIPTLLGYLAFLENEYYPRARHEIAVAANPGGAACYRASIRAYSGLDLDAATVHRLGLAEMDRIRAEMSELAESRFGTDDLDALLPSLKAGEYTFSTSQELVDYAEAAYARAEAAMSRWFGPQTLFDLVIEPYPEYREPGGTGEYQLAAPDGTRPGKFLIAAHDPTGRTRVGIESITFHETIPGHHLQASLAMRTDRATHDIAQFLISHAFTEGWGLYSERLAHEMGLYGDAADVMGMLSDQAARAARLVIDTGIHAFGWSREQAIEYMMANTTWPAPDIEDEIDRYIVWPGQATAYMLGYLELQSLRSYAEAELGEQFDIREFHDRVLEDGQVTLPLVRVKVERWVRGVRAEANRVADRLQP